MNSSAYVAYITPTAPTGTAEGDVCDIYRLSADKPELIVRGGEWGTTYVDPYPTMGEFGGHRVVFRSINDDYITVDEQPAWIDLGPSDGDILDLPGAIINFNGETLRLLYNIKLDSSWAKDFEETKYLGGSVQGDWNPAISRTGSLGVVAVSLWDHDTIQSLRRLAAYAGVCHVRTSEGSSFAADVQVSESREAGPEYPLVDFSLSYTRVDSEEPDGMTYDEFSVAGLAVNDVAVPSGSTYAFNGTVVPQGSALTINLF